MLTFVSYVRADFCVLLLTGFPRLATVAKQWLDNRRSEAGISEPSIHVGQTEARQLVRLVAKGCEYREENIQKIKRNIWPVLEDDSKIWYLVKSIFNWSYWPVHWLLWFEVVHCTLYQVCIGTFGNVLPSVWGDTGSFDNTCQSERQPWCVR